MTPTQACNTKRFFAWRSIAAAILLPAAPLWSTHAFGFEVPLGESDVTVRWDNTVKYSAGVRLRESIPALAGTSAGYVNNGDRNFSRGSLISNRADLLSELDATYKKRFGLRLSAAAWYDQAYLSSNDNPGPPLAAGARPYNEFPDNVRQLHGRKTEVLDAFVYGSGDLTETVSASLRLGRHSFQWGESLFFGANGISGTMAPIDVIKATSVPGTAFKDLLRKVPQISGTVSVGSDLAFGAYYQTGWVASRLPEPGSYFSSMDYTATGLAPLKPKDSGQGGLMARYVPPNSTSEFGLYWTRFHSKNPNGVYLERVANGPPPVILPRAFYHQGSSALGASYTITQDALNVGFEASVRRNVALPSLPGVPVAPGVPSNDASTARYAIGKSGHAQVNLSYALPPSALAEEAVVRAELAWNRLLSVTKNPGALDPQVDRDAVGLQVQLVPTYSQLWSGFNLSVPITVSYVNGRSGALGPGLGVHKGGAVSVGLSGTYLVVYNVGMTLTNYYGPTGLGRFDQTLRDRRFASLFVSTTF